MNKSPGRQRTPRIISVSSGKGGVGKTSFTVNLAAALARLSKRVLVIDGDLGLANVDVLLGLSVRHNLREVVEEGLDPAGVLAEVAAGFQVLPASSGVPEMANLSAPDQAFLTEALESLIGRFDFILVDTAAGLGESVLWFNNWADENVVILSPDPTSLTDAYALIKVLQSRYDRKRFHLLVNGAKSRKEGDAVFASISVVLERFLKIRPVSLGAIPHDGAVVRAIRMQQPFLLAQPKCRASLAVMEIAARIAAARQPHPA